MENEQSLKSSLFALGRATRARVLSLRNQIRNARSKSEQTDAKHSARAFVNYLRNSAILDLLIGWADEDDDTHALRRDLATLADECHPLSQAGNGGTGTIDERLSAMERKLDRIAWFFCHNPKPKNEHVTSSPPCPGFNSQAGGILDPAGRLAGLSRGGQN